MGRLIRDRLKRTQRKGPGQRRRFCRNWLAHAATHQAAEECDRLLDEEMRLLQQERLLRLKCSFENKGRPYEWTEWTEYS
jgi:hypothetical protein